MSHSFSSNLSSTQSSTLAVPNTFSCFPRLSYELRHSIWLHAVSAQDRQIDCPALRSIRYAPCPVLFLVCKESKLCTEPQYQRLQLYKKGYDIIMGKLLPSSARLGLPISFKHDLFVIQYDKWYEWNKYRNDYADIAYRKVSQRSSVCEQIERFGTAGVQRVCVTCETCSRIVPEVDDTDYWVRKHCVRCSDFCEAIYFPESESLRTRKYPAMNKWIWKWSQKVTQVHYRRHQTVALIQIFPTKNICKCSLCMPVTQRDIVFSCLLNDERPKATSSDMHETLFRRSREIGKLSRTIIQQASHAVEADFTQTAQLLMLSPQYRDIHSRLKAHFENVYRIDCLNDFLSVLPIVTTAPFSSMPEPHGHTSLLQKHAGSLKNIYDWADDRDGKVILWLHAPVGSGKSTLARMIAQHYSDQRRLGASFFFSAEESGDATYTNKVIPSLARQLANTVPSLHWHIHYAVYRNGGIMSQSLHTQWHQMILDPLLQMESSSCKPYILVINAIDKCKDEHYIQELIQLLSSLQTVTALQFRVLITSQYIHPTECNQKSLIQLAFSSSEIYTMSLEVSK